MPLFDDKNLKNRFQQGLYTHPLMPEQNIEEDEAARFFRDNPEMRQIYTQAMGLDNLPMGFSTFGEYVKDNPYISIEKVNMPLQQQDPTPEEVFKPEGKPRSPKSSFLLSDQAWMDVDMNTAAFMLGQSLSFDSKAMYDNPDMRSRGRTGNVLRGIGAAGKIGLNLGRVVGAGMGWQNRYQEAMDNYWQKQREAMTGDHLYEFAEDGGMLGNRIPVLEDGEYYQLPDGTVELVEGRTHEQGGEIMDLPDGTKVVSDHLNLGAKNAKRVRDDFKINVKAKDTYATTIDKYRKKIKLEDTKKELEALESRLGDQKDIKSDATKRLNVLYLQNKVVSLQEEIADKEYDVEQFTNQIFKLQETKKGKLDRNLINQVTQQYGYDADEVTNTLREYELRDGGKIDIIESNNALFKTKAQSFDMDTLDFAQYVTTHPREFAEDTVAQAQFFVNKGTKKFQTGDLVFGSTPKKRKDSDRENKLLTAANFDFALRNPQAVVEFETQSFDPATGRYGNFVESQAAIDYYDRYLPDNLSGNILVGEGSNRAISKDPTKIKTFQEQFNPFMQDTGAYFVEKGWQKQEDIDAYLDAVLFQDGDATARGFDSKAGNFTLSRSMFRQRAVSPEQKKLLNEAGIYTKGHLDKNPEKAKEIIGDELFKDLTDTPEGKSIDYVLEEILPDEKAKEEPTNENIQDTPDEKEEVQKTDPGTISEEDFLRAMELSNKPAVNRPLFLPDQSQLPPDPLMPHLKIERSYDRIFPEDITDEATLKELFRSQDTAIDSLQGLTDSQSRAALASITAGTQEGINRSKAETRGQNIQRDLMAQQFNISQQAREEDTRAHDMLDFERRQYTALGTTMEDYHNYFEFDRKRRVADFNLRNTINNINALSDNYYTDEFGRVRKKPGSDLAFAMTKLMQQQAEEAQTKKKK